MNNDLNQDTVDIAHDALQFALQIEQLDDLRLLLATSISMIAERPNNSPRQYLDALTTIAKNHQMLAL